MNEFEIKADIEPKNNYEKALKLLIETDNAFQKLIQQEKQKLVLEYTRYKGTEEFYYFLKQYLG